MRVYLHMLFLIFTKHFRRADDANVIIMPDYPYLINWSKEKVEIEYLYYDMMIENFIDCAESTTFEKIS